MIEESLTVTRAQWNAALDYVLRSPPNPDKIFVSRGFSATYRIVQRSIDEGWDRRREKREVRKGEKSTYHKRKTVGTSAQNGRESAADTTDNDRQPPVRTGEAVPLQSPGNPGFCLPTDNRPND